MHTDSAPLQGLTREQRDQYIGVDRRTWSRWLSGAHRVPLAVSLLARIIAGGDLLWAGPEWEGWQLRRWGKSKRYTLQAPNGQRFTPREIMELPRLMLDVDYLRARLRNLEDSTACQFSAADARTLREAMRILERELPPGPRRELQPDGMPPELRAAK